MWFLDMTFYNPGVLTEENFILLTALSSSLLVLLNTDVWLFIKLTRDHVFELL